MRATRSLLPEFLAVVLVLGTSVHIAAQAAPAAQTAQAPQASAVALDVCALLPRDEAMKILGRQGPGRTRGGQRSDGATECHYTGGMQGTITIVVGAATPKAKWDAFMKKLMGSGAPLEPVAGVGDGAFFWDSRLYAHAGSYEVTVSTSPAPGDIAAKVRADAVALGKAIFAKLKG